MEHVNTVERPRARQDVVFRQLDEEWVIYDPAADRLHVLNLTAALVWMHCTGELTNQQIADLVGGAFSRPVDGRQVAPDVEQAIARFRVEHLLA